MTNTFSIAIQAGGKSSRMGMDKGLVPFGQMTLVEYIHQQIKSLGQEVFLVSNTPEKYQQFGLPVYTDIYQDIGALAGIHTVLFHTKTDYTLILACDMPFVNEALIEFLVSHTANYDVVVPRIDPRGFVEPFKAVYGEACLPAIENAIKAGNRKVISFFDDVRVKYVEVDEIRQFDPELLSFMNVNTPEDLEKALEIAKLNLS